MVGMNQEKERRENQKNSILVRHFGDLFMGPDDEIVTNYQVRVEISE